MKQFLKDHWGIILRIIQIISIVAVIILAIAIPVYLLKHPSTELGANPNAADYFYDFLNEWASAGAPAVTLIGIIVALFIGVLSIRRTDNIQRTERKERLLNEIITWAESVANSAISRQKKDPHELWTTKLEYKKHKTKGKYIFRIINSSFPELSQFYSDIDAKLEGAIAFIEDIDHGKIGKEATGGLGGRTLRECETGIAESVGRLFEEAAKIKTTSVI